jgi:hypothetical protein
MSHAPLTDYQLHSVNRLLHISKEKAPSIENYILKKWNALDIEELPAIHYEEIMETIANHLTSTF